MRHENPLFTPVLSPTQSHRKLVQLSQNKTQKNQLFHINTITINNAQNSQGILELQLHQLFYWHTQAYRQGYQQIKILIVPIMFRKYIFPSQYFNFENIFAVNNQYYFYPNIPHQFFLYLILSYNFIRVADSHMNMKQAQYESPEFVGSKSIHQNQRIRVLKVALFHNKKSQDELKNLRATIKKRMNSLQEYIGSYKINSEYPPFTALLSYLKFQRNLPMSFREMVRVSQTNSPFNSKQEEECEFMNKLIQTKSNKKKKEIHLKDLPQRPNIDHFVELSKDSQYKSGLQLYRAWFESKKVKGPKKLFTMAEDNLINDKHSRYGQNWQKICSFIQVRTFDQLYYEYHNRINPDLISGRWSIRHTLMLLILIEHYGAKKWSLISSKMKVKSELQVRERYATLLDTTIGKDIWTYQLQKTLLQIAEQHNFCWKKISQLTIFKSKSDNCIWRRYRNLMMRFSEDEIRHILHPKSNNRNLADKIIKEKRIYESRKRSANNRPQPPIYFKQHQAPNTFSPKSITPINRNRSDQNPSILNGNIHENEANFNHIQYERESEFFPNSRASHSEIFQESGEQDI